MFGFIKKMFISLLTSCSIECFSESLAFNPKGAIKCVSLKNQSCQTRTTIVNVNSDKNFSVYC